MTTVKHYSISLKLPSIVALLLAYGRHVVQSMTNNTWVPSPPTPLATVTTDLDALETAESTAKSGAKGTAAARNAKKKTAIVDLKDLAGYTEKTANQNPDHAIEIIQSSGFTARQFTHPNKPPLQAKMGPTPGEVIVRAKAVAKRAAYEWQVSSDGGKTWTTFATTTVADSSILNLTPGTTYSFRFRTTVKKTTSDWGQPISFLVH
jgi:hypothetical protein